MSEAHDDGHADGPDLIEAAAGALEDGRPEDALELLATLPEDAPDRLLIEGLARLDLADLAGARAALDRAARGLPAGDLDLSSAFAELLLAEWRVDEARAELERLVQSERSPSTLERLALCLELEDDFAGADELYAEGSRLDGGDPPPPPRLDDAAFDAVVERAIEELPPRFRAALDNVRIVTEPMPFADLVEPSDPAATPPELLGLFVGPTLHDLAEERGAELPPAIYLFQRNLERMARDTDHLIEEIRVTLYHEIGHLLGLDEDDVEAMGLG